MFVQHLLFFFERFFFVVGFMIFFIDQKKKKIQIDDIFYHRKKNGKHIVIKKFFWSVCIQIFLSFSLSLSHFWMIIMYLLFIDSICYLVLYTPTMILLMLSNFVYSDINKIDIFEHNNVFVFLLLFLYHRHHHHHYPYNHVTHQPYFFSFILTTTTTMITMMTIDPIQC